MGIFHELGKLYCGCSSKSNDVSSCHQWVDRKSFSVLSVFRESFYLEMFHHQAQEVLMINSFYFTARRRCFIVVMMVFGFHSWIIDFLTRAWVNNIQSFALVLESWSSYSFWVPRKKQAHENGPFLKRRWTQMASCMNKKQQQFLWAIQPSKPFSVLPFNFKMACCCFHIHHLARENHDDLTNKWSSLSFLSLTSEWMKAESTEVVIVAAAEEHQRHDE